MAIDPSTGHEFAELPATAPAEVADYVEDARRALAEEQDWRTPLVRAGALARWARLVEDQAQTLADFETRDTGKPLSQSRADARATVRCLEYYAGSIERLEGRTTPLGPDALDYTVREPWGVCGQIVPFSSPLRITARRAAPALAAGNAVILKPSELASITPLRLAQLAYEAGVPPGMFHVVTGDGATGDALVRHPGVDHVTFVGSAATGAKVAAACARRLIPVELELGGKPPHILFADADLEDAVPAIVKHLLRSGSAGSRLLVHKSIFEDVTARIGAAFARVKLAPGIEDPDLGPLISERRRQRATEMLETARAHGARVLGGETDALFMKPALVTRVRLDMEIFHEEVLGPVLVAVAFEDERHAVELANATAHSLVAGVWTSDLARAHRVASGVRAEQVFVNGLGVERESVDALLAYTRTKTVRVALTGRAP